VSIKSRLAVILFIVLGMKKKLILGFGILSLLVSCKDKEDVDPVSLYEEGEEFLGGTASTSDYGSYSFEHEISSLSKEEKMKFFSGNAFFKQTWVSSPSSTTARDGLGPFFNAKSCSSCHPSDGRGRPPKFYGEKQQGLLFRLHNGVGVNGQPLPDPIYGGQLQDLALPGIDVEGQMKIDYEYLIRMFDDGKSYTLRYPTYSIAELSHGDLDLNTKISPRVGQQLIGLGLLEAISQNDLLENEDVNDKNGDGISGKANYVWSVLEQKNVLGRFGWKANQPSLKQQVSGAFNGDIGITSSMFLSENCNPWVDCYSIANGGSPEISDELINEQVLYVSALAVPVRRNVKDDAILKGKQMFTNIGCVSCHKDKFITSTSPTLSGLSNQTIRPYTDLLLHDMGDSLSDNSKEFLAEGNEWRTPPLWGIGLIKTVNGHQYLLHDGRAQNIEEAILWHGGEAQKSKKEYIKLCEADRQKMIKFLESL
jgi:CxxC motif-containing protein (DUF1111 family)